MLTINYGINLKLALVGVGVKLHLKEILVAVVGMSLFASTFIVPYHSFLPAWRHNDKSCEISPGGSTSFNINSSFGSTIQFMLVVDREGILHLTTKNEENRTIIDQILSSGRYYYSIPSESGIYNVSLENGGTSVQSIYWIVWTYYYNTSFQFIGITFSGLACLMLVAHRKEREEEEIQTPIITQVKEETNEDKKPILSSDVVEEAKKVLQDLKEKKSA